MCILVKGTGLYSSPFAALLFIDVVSFMITYAYFHFFRQNSFRFRTNFCVSTCLTKFISVRDHYLYIILKNHLFGHFRLSLKNNFDCIQGGIFSIIF